MHEPETFGNTSRIKNSLFLRNVVRSLRVNVVVQLAAQHELRHYVQTVLVLVRADEVKKKRMIERRHDVSFLGYSLGLTALEQLRLRLHCTKVR